MPPLRGSGCGWAKRPNSAAGDAGITCATRHSSAAATSAIASITRADNSLVGSYIAPPLPPRPMTGLRVADGYDNTPARSVPTHSPRY